MVKVSTSLNKENFRIGSYFPEFMSALFLFLFSLLHPFVVSSSSSAIILFSSSVIALVVLYAYIVMHNKIKISFRAGLIMCSVIIFLLFFDLLFRDNDNISNYMYDFSLNGILPMLFLVTVREYKPLLWFYAHFAILTGLIYLLDPLLYNYKWSVDYMQYGYNYMMPAVFGSMLMFFYFKKNIYLPIIFIFTISIFIFANKGVIFAEVVGFIYYYLNVYKKNKVSIYKYAFVILLIFLVIYNFEVLIYYGFNIANMLEIGDSYSLNTFAVLFSSDSSYVVSQRTELWDFALKMLEEKPLLGWGVGWYEKFSTQPYPHNFIYEILVEYGLVGGILFSLFFVISFRKLLKTVDFEKKVFLFTLLILWIIPLSISLTFWKTTYFWAFWLLLYTTPKCLRINNVKRV